MRKDHPYCLIVGDNSENFYELCNSLKFSTHCNYHILSSIPPFDIDNYIYMKCSRMEDFAFEEIDKEADIIYILCHEEKVDFGKTRYSDDLRGFIINKLQQLASKDDHNSDDSRLFQKLLIENFSYTIQEKLQNILLFDKVNKIRLDFICDYEGGIGFIGGVVEEVISSNNYQIKLIEKDLHYYLREWVLGFSNKGNSTKNRIISVDIFIDRLGEDLRIECVLDNIQLHWMFYRASGINLPLIIIQNLLNRKVKTYYLVDPEYISCQKDVNRPSFGFGFDTVYFDLDETLIWKGKPLKDMINLLMALYQKNYSLKLITRHELSISDTLSSIGLDSIIFNEIIYVSPEQKKSSFITQYKSFFIDNEFPQRLDVSLNCKIPVLDLDQVDFLLYY